MHSHDTSDRAAWSVSRCACGSYHVKLGSVSLELDRHEFIKLAQLLTAAAHQFTADDKPDSATHSTAH